MDWLIIPIAGSGCLLSALFASFFGGSIQEEAKVAASELDLRAALPGHDCGICGSENCDLYARDLASGRGDPGRCSPGGVLTEEKLRSSLGGDFIPRRVAIISCSAGKGKNRNYYSYEGARDCWAAMRIYGGPKACRDACTGLGSCIKACPLGAISIRDGLASIDSSRCTGCGRCLSSCPSECIGLARRDAPWYIACNSGQNPAIKLEDCEVSCTACGECETRSDAWQFTIKGGLAIFSGQSGDLGPKSEIVTSIALACPTGVIRRLEDRKRRLPLPEANSSGYTRHKIRRG